MEINLTFFSEHLDFWTEQTGCTAKCFRIPHMRKCNRIEDAYPKFERCLHCLMVCGVMFGKWKYIEYSLMGLSFGDFELLSGPRNAQ